MSKHYEPDLRGLGEIARSKEMGRAMVSLAQAGVAGARAVSPVVSGQYRDSFVVEETTRNAGWRNEPRAAARVTNTAPYAAKVEREHKVLSKVASIIEAGG